MITPTRVQLNLGATDQIYTWLDKTRPTIIVNAAAFTDVDGAEINRQEALALNAQLPQRWRVGVSPMTLDYYIFQVIMSFRVVKKASSTRL